MRILSRMLAFAFDKNDVTTEVYSIECATVECRPDMHTVLQCVDTEQEVYDWQGRHAKETGHTEFRVYVTQVRRSRLMQFGPDDA